MNTMNSEVNIHTHDNSNGQKPVGGYIFCVLSCTPGAKRIDFQYDGLRDDTHIPADYPRDNHEISVQKSINHSLKTGTRVSAMQAFISTHTMLS